MTNNMYTIDQRMHNESRGEFIIEENSQRLAEMTFALENGNMIVYHTEVSDALKGKGVAQLLLDHMEKYVRQHQLKVIPLCPYVSVQFRRHADRYKDITSEDWHPQS